MELWPGAHSGDVLFAAASPSASDAPRMKTVKKKSVTCNEDSLVSCSASSGSGGTPNRRSQLERITSLTYMVPADIDGCPTPQPVTLHALRVNMTQLQAINHMNQTFTARYFMHFVLKGAAQEDDLCADLDPNSTAFPTDGTRPGVGWYLNQIDFPTAASYSIYSKKVSQLDKNDLHLTIDVIGTFYESMELQNYPMDVQKLTMVVSFNCAKEGMVPIEFDSTALKSAAFFINRDTFALANIWILRPGLVVEKAEVNPMPARTYPALTVSVLVERQPFTLFVNVAVPVSTLTLLTGLNFFIPLDDYQTRLANATTLMLTSAAYKLVVATQLPEVAYMTLLDKYVLSCYALMAFVVAEGATVPALRLQLRVFAQEVNASIAESSADTKQQDIFDFACACAFVGAYVLLHLYCAYRILICPRHVHEVNEARRIGDSAMLASALQEQEKFMHALGNEIGIEYNLRASKMLGVDHNDESHAATPKPKMNSKKKIAFGPYSAVAKLGASTRNIMSRAGMRKQTSACHSEKTKDRPPKKLRTSVGGDVTTLWGSDVILPGVK